MAGPGPVCCRIRPGHTGPDARPDTRIQGRIRARCRVRTECAAARGGLAKRLRAGLAITAAACNTGCNGRDRTGLHPGYPGRRDQRRGRPWAGRSEHGPHDVAVRTVRGMERRPPLAACDAYAGGKHTVETLAAAPGAGIPPAAGAGWGAAGGCARGAIGGFERLVTRHWLVKCPGACIFDVGIERPKRMATGRAGSHKRHSVVMDCVDVTGLFEAANCNGQPNVRVSIANDSCAYTTY